MTNTNIPEFKFLLNEGLDDSFLPTKGEPYATGYDVSSTIDIDLKPGEYAKIPLGFRVLAPPGWWLELRPRSSTFAKKSLHSLYGVIDEHYENELVFACQYGPQSTTFPLHISKGERIGQLVPVLRQEMIVTKISEEEFQALSKERNAVRKGGFGSTG